MEAIRATGRTVTLSYKVAGTLSVAAFLALFAAGVVINSEPFRSELVAHPFNLKALLAVILTYTPTNVALLALLSGITGGCASKITYDNLLKGDPETLKGIDPALWRKIGFLTESPFASMFRSLVVYLAFMAGVLITNIDPLISTTPQQYVRVAAAVSFFSFIVGYDPTKFQDLLNLRIPTRERPDKAATD